MNKPLIIAGTLALLGFTVVSAQGIVVSYSFQSDLSVGATGQGVAELQTWLLINSYDIPAIRTGAAQKGYSWNRIRRTTYPR